MVPWRVEWAPSVAKLPTTQKTFDACAPLMTNRMPACWTPRGRGRGLEDEDGAVALGVKGDSLGDPERFRRFVVAPHAMRVRSAEFRRDGCRDALGAALL